ncbi:MAG TPA: class III aminotransferase [Clostridiales bacterium]|nr:class III aminotransferase [Clostridiales bacterium]
MKGQNTLDKICNFSPVDSTTSHNKAILDELTGFLPGSVFDAHAHIFKTSNFNPPLSTFLSECPEVTGIDTWQQCMASVFGFKPEGGLFMPYPVTGCDIELANDFLIDQLNKAPKSKGLLMVPMTEEMPVYVKKHMDHPQICGYKPYYMFSNEQPITQASIRSFVPEWVWEDAHKKNRIIMLHIVKDQALADPDNLKVIKEKCNCYPGMKLILAHAGRGFHALNTKRGIASLRRIQNIWFDMSGICESAPIMAILKEFGPSKLLWGSDFPISQVNARCVTVGDGFLWTQNDVINNNKVNISYRPAIVCIESLRALKEAVDLFGLSRVDLNNIFYGNAYDLLNITKKMNNRTQNLYDRAKIIIPGGTQLLSKRPEQFAPKLWPAYFQEARGCEVWDLDGNHYYDMSINGVSSCLLGYRDEDVTKAVTRRINLGSMSTLNPPEEVYLAEKLLEIHPWAKGARFARCGGEIATVAVRIARAVTDRSMIAICGYHGWHDWYLAANLGENDALRGHLLSGLDPLGVPVELRNTATTFVYGDKEAFDRVIDQYGDRLAAVIMEPCRYHDPKKGYLEHIRNETRKRGILLIFDEITIGWRRNFGGSHLQLGVNPDLAIFAKAMGNGHPIAAVIGTKEAMEGAIASFISSTYWTESVGPVAALATIEKLERLDVAKVVNKSGEKVLEYWKRFGKQYNLPVDFDDGYPCLAHFKFQHSLSKELETLYTQLMLERGFLAGVSMSLTLAHTDDIIDLYGKAIEEVFHELSKYIKAGNLEEKFKGPVHHTGFQRLL